MRSGNIAIDEDRGVHGVALRTSARQYNTFNEFEAVFFDCARGDTVKLFLRKKDGVKHYVDVEIEGKIPLKTVAFRQPVILWKSSPLFIWVKNKD